MSSEYLPARNQIYIPDPTTETDRVQLLQTYANDDVKSDWDCANKCTGYGGGGYPDQSLAPSSCQFYAYGVDNRTQRRECQLYSTGGEQVEGGRSYPYDGKKYGNPIQGIIPIDGSIGTGTCGRPPPETAINTAQDCKDYCVGQDSNRCPLSAATYDGANGCACLRFNYMTGSTGFIQ